jgi:chemotaxis protein CheC
MVIIQTPQTAYELIDMLMGEPQGTTTEFGEMEQSVLGEVGNVMGAHFLNTISDTTGLDLRVSPPAVMLDMAASILSPSIAGLMSYAEDALVLDTTFGTEDRQIHGKFLVMPNPELQDTLLTQLAS